MLAEPFSQIFLDQAEAEWAFDLLRDTAVRLGIHGAYDPRFAITLTQRSGRLGLHLNFGGWLVLGFHGPGQSPARVDLALLADRVAWDERFTPFPFDRKEGEREVRNYHLPLETIRPMTSNLATAYEATLDFIAQKFQHWKRASHWQQHRPEIAEALFKPEQRERVFAGLLAEPELRYERHLTAFYQDLSEESEEYEVGGGETGRRGDEETRRRGDENTVETDNHYSLQGRNIVNLNQQKTEEILVQAFSEFRQDLQALFVVRLRRKRAEQLRRLLSNPDTVDLQTFNQEVWLMQSKRNSSKTIDLYNKKPTSLEQISEIEKAIDTGELELHGNCIWGSATRIFAPKLNDDSQKIKNIRQALHILNDSDPTPTQKARQINQINGFGPNVTTGLVMVFHPTEFGLYNEQGKQILKKLGYQTSNSLDSYQETLRTLKEILNARDFLELDWFLYLVNRDRYISPPKESQVATPIMEEVIEEGPVNYKNPLYSLPQLAEDTGFDEAELERWVRAIERKGQAILYGPPGTGKTFVAEKLAAHLIGGGDGFCELVQFHPAYAYEDFIQGIRPESKDDHLTYPVKPGRFLEFCGEANRREGRCVLIIDEINRANLSRVFGELMYLLEYRTREIPLAGGGSFRIPANVRLIGTMNTADRSIALVDHALRRRFAFLALYPNYELLRRYHRREQTGFPVEGLIDTLTNLNRQIGDRHYEVGVTFFLGRNLAGQIEDIWRLEIEPYLEEYFFDRPENVESFRWDKVKAKIL